MTRVGEDVGDVKRVNGVPVWFTRLVHAWRRRQCARVGHVGDYTCLRCGLIQRVAR